MFTAGAGRSPLHNTTRTDPPPHLATTRSEERSPATAPTTDPLHMINFAELHHHPLAACRLRAGVVQDRRRFMLTRSASISNNAPQQPLFGSDER